MLTTSLAKQQQCKTFSFSGLTFSHIIITIIKYLHKPTQYILSIQFAFWLNLRHGIDEVMKLMENPFRQQILRF